MTKINNLCLTLSQVQRLIGVRTNEPTFDDEAKVQWGNLAGARGHTGGAANAARREDGAFGPRETETYLLLEVGDGPHDGRYFQSRC